GWQVVEERVDGDVHVQYLWCLSYIDTPVLRWRDTSEVPDQELDETLYYTVDANKNVTALIDGTPESPTEGQVVERYLYDPYGRVMFLKPDWSPQEVTGHDDGAASAFGNEILFTGYRWNPAPGTGTYHARNREYHPLLGRFMQRDPLGYVDGGNLYAAYFAMLGGVDPEGLAATPRVTYGTIHFNFVNGHYTAFQGAGQKVPKGVDSIYMHMPGTNNPTSQPHTLRIAITPTEDGAPPAILTVEMSNFAAADAEFLRILDELRRKGVQRTLNDTAGGVLQIGDIVIDLAACVATVVIPGPEIFVALNVLKQPFVRELASKGIEVVEQGGKYVVRALPGRSVPPERLRDAARQVQAEHRAELAARSAATRRVPTGQTHHPISTKVGRAIDNHPSLKGAFDRRDPRFVTRASDGASHRGYQRWHRDLDNEVVNWIERNPDATPDDFLSYLRELYKRPDLVDRFPGGF
ncbi:MAG: hypothetical protein JJU36_14315, partial [Phycisphaeraceae bacterium]|nr:hypothetical protein [Phycisphaeraceae bacterium]